MPPVHLPVFELYPPTVEWMKRNNLWIPDFETGAIRLEKRKYPCLCLDDELFLQESLEAKISAYLSPSEARDLLLIAARMGRVRVSPEKEVDHLVGIELVQWQKKLLLGARPILLSPQVQRLLKIQ